MGHGAGWITGHRAKTFQVFSREAFGRLQTPMNVSILPAFFEPVQRLHAASAAFAHEDNAMQRTPAMRVLVPALLVAISALSGAEKRGAAAGANAGGRNRDPGSADGDPEYRAAGPDQCVPHRRGASPGERHHPQAPVQGRQRRQGRAAALPDRPRHLRGRLPAPRPTWPRPRSRPSATSCWSPTRP